MVCSSEAADRPCASSNRRNPLFAFSSRTHHIPALRSLLPTFRFFFTSCIVFSDISSPFPRHSTFLSYLETSTTFYPHVAHDVTNIDIRAASLNKLPQSQAQRDGTASRLKRQVCPENFWPCFPPSQTPAPRLISTTLPPGAAVSNTGSLRPRCLTLEITSLVTVYRLLPESPNIPAGAMTPSVASMADILASYALLKREVPLASSKGHRQAIYPSRAPPRDDGLASPLPPSLHPAFFLLSLNIYSSIWLWLWN